MIPPAPLKLCGESIRPLRYCVLCVQPFTLGFGGRKRPMKRSIFIGFFVGGRVTRERKCRIVELSRLLVESLPAKTLSLWESLMQCRGMLSYCLLSTLSLWESLMQFRGNVEMLRVTGYCYWNYELHEQNQLRDHIRSWFCLGAVLRQKLVVLELTAASSRLWWPCRSLVR